MPKIREVVQTWWSTGPSTLDPTGQTALALRLFRGVHCEDKLAGTLALQELLLPHLTLNSLGGLAALFDEGLIADWNTCDWFCVKVLSDLITRDLPGRSFADAVADWKTADNLWRRRASNVAFIKLAKRGDENFTGFVDLMLETCCVTVCSGERFAQTGVGWLLRELATVERARVLAFTSAHLSKMSREGVRYVIERMPSDVQQRMLKKHASLTRTLGDHSAKARATGGRQMERSARRARPS